MQTPDARAGLGLMVRMSLPWLSGAGDESEAARAEASASEAELATLEREIRVDVAEAIGALARARRALVVLREIERPAVARALDATTAALATEPGSVLDYIDAARAQTELDLEEAQLVRDAALAAVALENAVGGSIDATATEAP
jgi:outer membrane protein TolC